MPKMCVAAANELIKLSNTYGSIRPELKMTPDRLAALLYFCDIEYMTHHYAQSMFSDTFYIDKKGILIAGIEKRHFKNGIAKLIPLNYGNKERSPLTSEERKVIKKVFEYTKEMSTNDLQRLIRVKNGPWYNAAIREKNRSAIDRVSIYGFYKDKQWISDANFA